MFGIVFSIAVLHSSDLFAVISRKTIILLRHEWLKTFLT